MYSRGTPEDIYMITSDTTTLQWLDEARKVGKEVIVKGVGASMVTLESTQMLNTLLCPPEYLVMRIGTGNLLLHAKFAKSAHRKSLMRTRLMEKVDKHFFIKLAEKEVEFVRQLVKQQRRIIQSKQTATLLTRIAHGEDIDGYMRVHPQELIEKLELQQEWADLAKHVGTRAMVEMCRAVTDSRGPLTGRMLVTIKDAVLGRKVTYVQGPPGTGKSMTNAYCPKYIL